jgi:hypothetical protein
VNLVHREHCFLNEQLTPEEYQKRVKELHLSTWSGLVRAKQLFNAFAQKQPRPHATLHNAEACSGNHIHHSRDVTESVLVENSENLRYCYHVYDHSRDCLDYTIYGTDAELCYECLCCGDRAYALTCCHECWDNSSELLYCQYCVQCRHCFGCISLFHREYCILNRQVTKEEYEDLVPRIIEHMRKTGEWGEFFPAAATPFAYNKTLAHRFFPKTRTEAIAEGFTWNDEEIEEVASAVDAEMLNDTIPATDETIIAKSTQSGRAFKITSREVRRCRTLGIPLPRTTYDERIADRALLLGGVRFYDRTSAKSGRPLRTTIAPDDPAIVWHREEWEKEFLS